MEKNKSQKLNFLNKQSPVLAFLIKAALFYSGWFIIYYLIIEPKTQIDEFFITHIIRVSDIILGLFKYETFTETNDRTFQLIGIVGGKGNPGVWVGTACNALTLFALFSIFIISFPGKWKNKFWFVPLGVLIIHCLNIIRVCALAMIAFYNYNLLNFNHTYTFTIIVYGLIFLLWIWWVKKFSHI